MNASSNNFSDNSSSKLSLCVVLVFAFSIRLAVLLIMPEGLNRDTDAYRKIAETLRSSGTFGFPSPNRHDDPDASIDQVPDGTKTSRPTAFRPPLYPIVLSLLINRGQLSVVAVGALHLGCGLLTVALVWLLGRQWGLGKLATFAAMLTACDPILLNQSTQLMTETLASLNAVLALWGLTNCYRRPSIASAILAGLLLGLACLCRPTFLPWSVLVVGSCLFMNCAELARWKIAVSMAAGIAISISPWGIRNAVQFGKLKFTTTHGGYTLLLGNNPSCYRFLREGRWGSVWDSRELDDAWLRRGGLRDADDDLFATAKPLPSGNGPSGVRPNVTRTEFEDDRLAYEFARRYIREAPTIFLYSCLHRVGSLWQVLPHRVSHIESTGGWSLRWGTAVWYLAVFALAILGGWQLRGKLLSPPWLWGILLCLVFTGVHSLYWSNMRMRSPLVPFVSLLAAAGMASCRRSGANPCLPDRSTNGAGD